MRYKYRIIKQNEKFKVEIKDWVLRRPLGRTVCGGFVFIPSYFDNYNAAFKALLKWYNIKHAKGIIIDEGVL